MANGLITFGLTAQAALDEIDGRTLAVLQNHCKTALARVGEAVARSAPSVLERIRKMEVAGVITGDHAVLDGGRLRLEVTAFIGLSIDDPKRIESFAREVLPLALVMEIHHVTGPHSLLLEVRTCNTATLETLLSQLRAIDGVLRTDTMIVLSTRVERLAIPRGLLGELPSVDAPRAPVRGRPVPRAKTRQKRET